MSDARLPRSIGRYEIVSRLGQGAMGRVFLAQDPVLSRQVAIKVLRNDLGLVEEHRLALLDRMRQEARASARVSHPNIVTLFDMGEDPELGLFLVFEYVQGPTLKERIALGPLGAAVVRDLARQLGSALATAHQAGVLHRDIKPENVILASTGAKIADFGIARIPESTLTRDGRLLGTPAYSSPESIATGAFSAASDQFSLAATLYEAISGQRAFPGDDAVQVAASITTDNPPMMAARVGVDARVDLVLAQALQKDPRDRYPDCEQFGSALASVLSGLAPSRPVAVTPRAPAATLPPTRDRLVGPRSLRLAVGGAALGGLLTLGALQLFRSCQPPVPPAPAPVDAGPDLEQPWNRTDRILRLPGSAASQTSKPRRAHRPLPSAPPPTAQSLADSGTAGTREPGDP